MEDDTYKPEISKDTTTCTTKAKPRRRNKDYDEMLLLPNHDFYQADYAMNDYYDTQCDIDQIRLIQFLAFVYNVEPYNIQNAIQRILHQRHK